MLCSTTIIECPFFINALNDFNNFLISWKCKPVVGSSKINSDLLCLVPFTKNDANLIR